MTGVADDSWLAGSTSSNGADRAEEVPTWLTPPGPVIGPTQLALAGEALGGLLGEAAAAIDLEALAAELLAGDQPGGTVRYATTTEIVGALVLAAVQRVRAAEADRRTAEIVADQLRRDAGGIDAADLLALELQPLRAIVPDAVYEGTTVIAAEPKIGKSTFVYQMTVEVALGGELLGRRVASGSALYLALEDGQRRGQARLRAALAGRTMPRGRLEVRWSAPMIGQGLEDSIAAWLDAHADAAIVAIDTLGKVRPHGDSRRSAYQVDVEDLGRLQALFRDRPVGLVIVHHARKQASDDFLASVSGTYGISGSADTVIVVKRKRHEEFGTLDVTGRDAPEIEIPVRFHDGLWDAAPAALPEASFERTEVFRVIDAHGPLFAKAIADMTGLERTSVQHLVGKLADSGAVVRTTKGYVSRARTVPDNSDHSGSEWSEAGHTRATSPLSVGDRTAAIFADEPEDADEPDDMGPVLASLFPDFPVAEAAS